MRLLALLVLCLMSPSLMAARFARTCPVLLLTAAINLGEDSIGN